MELESHIKGDTWRFCYRSKLVWNCPNQEQGSNTCASKSDQAGNAKFVYCDGSGLAADNRLQLEGLIEGAQICTNECLENIGAIKIDHKTNEMK